MAEEGMDSFTASGSESAFEFFCEFCNENGHHLEAEGHCTRCDEYLCGKCISNHRGTRLTRHHDILVKDNMPRNTPPSSDRVRKDISTMCEQHKGEPVNFYCKSHGELTCSKCIVKSHKACADVIDITEITNTLFDDMDYKEFIQKLKSLETQVHKILTMSCEQTARSERFCSEAIGSVRQFRDKINSVLNDIETNLENEADAIKLKDATKMETLGNTCRILQETIEKISSEFRELQSEKRVCQAYIRMKEIAVDVEKVKEGLAEAEDNISINELVFVPNTKLTDFLKGPNAFGLFSTNDKIDQKNQDIVLMTNVGSSASYVKINNFPSVENESNAQNTVPISKAIGSIQFINELNVLSGDSDEVKKMQDSYPVSQVISTASFVHDINVKSTTDGAKAIITGSTVLSDSRLLIVDHYNYKLKLLDTQSMSIINEFQVSDQPWDDTVITGDHVAVTVPRQKTILVLRVTDSIIKEREIRVQGKCHGIAFSKNQPIVSYCDPGKLEIMDMQGNISITIDRDKDGNKLFNRPEYICVSNDGDTIYVSDYNLDSGKVVSLTRYGEIKAIYTDNTLKGPQKVCIDHRGNVFVCGYRSHNIHMLTPDCTNIKVIRDQTDWLMTYVCSVSHCKQTDRLYVGLDGYFNVIVYQLS